MPAIVGILHPGEMGAAVGAALVRAGDTVLWASAGRSPETAGRAAGAGLEDVGSVAALAARAELVLSVCPPHAAAEVAAACGGFAGVFVDANAVAPATARALLAPFGARGVDGGIVGPPPRHAGSTRLYLSGPHAGTVAERFAPGPLEPIVLDGGIGAASALKATYAAWTKGTAALLLALRDVAAAHGVLGALEAEWARSQPSLPERLAAAEASAAAKGWRWVAEMDEIAATFEAAGAPGGFHRAAAEVFRR
jgi:uncharacterized protein DUF1932